jgi:hypothetical protein
VLVCDCLLVSVLTTRSAAQTSPAHKRADQMASPARMPSASHASTSSDEDSDEYAGFRVQRPLRSKSGQSIYSDDLGDDESDMILLSQAMSQAMSETQEAPAQGMDAGNDGSHLTLCPLCDHHFPTHFIQTHCNECMRHTQPDGDFDVGADSVFDEDEDEADEKPSDTQTDGAGDFDVGAHTLFDEDEADENENDGSGDGEVAESEDDEDEDEDEDEADENESDGSADVEVASENDEDEDEADENADEDRCVAAELYVANEEFVDDDGAYDSDGSYTGGECSSSSSSSRSACSGVETETSNAPSDSSSDDFQAV